MPHDVTLIATIAAAFGLALVLGLLAAQLRLPPLVGYLLAGIAIGPATPGFVADVVLAGQLAEIGVMLLMFGVGLHFSMGDLMAVKRIAIPGALLQIGVAIARALADAKVPCVVAEQSRELVDQLRAGGQAAVCGDAARPETLVQAHIANASMLVIAIREAPDVRAMVQTARMLNPAIQVAIRAANSEEARLIRADGLGEPFVSELELAGGMARHVVAALQAAPEAPKH